MGQKNILLLTGYTGFIGGALAKKLVTNLGYRIVAPVRRSNIKAIEGVTVLRAGNLAEGFAWPTEANGATTVIHAAARAHVLNEAAASAIDDFRAVNLLGTLNLAQCAIDNNVKRFIFISSIGVNGVQSSRPFLETDAPNPIEPYAISKWEAEKALLELTKGSPMELVVIRPPLVYGPNAPGSFSRLVKVVERGLPLPFGGIKNRRSFVGLDNLVDLIITCINHPAAANQLFLAGEDADMSTPELVQKLGKALSKPVSLFTVPTQLLIMAGALLGKKTEVQRLCGSLQVDNSKVRSLLSWEPPISVDEGLRRMVEGYKN